MSNARSSQSGLLSSISLIFQARFHFLIRFSRVIACSIVACRSNHTSPMHAVAFREAFYQAFAVLMHALDEIRGDPDVESTIPVRG